MGHKTRDLAEVAMHCNRRMIFATISSNHQPEMWFKISFEAKRDQFWGKAFRNTWEIMPCFLRSFGQADMY